MEPIYDDPQLAPAIEEHGELSVEPHPDTFQRFVESIINQQLSTSSAAAIKDRVFRQFEVTPEAILAAEEEALRETGLSRAKVDYIKNVAEAFQERELSREYFADRTNEEVIEELTDIHGVGVWTAKMFCLFCLGREDVFPIEDLGIRGGMEILYGEMSREEMLAKADDWRPYRSYASLYLWRIYEG